MTKGLDMVPPLYLNMGVFFPRIAQNELGYASISETIYEFGHTKELMFLVPA